MDEHLDFLEVQNHKVLALHEHLGGSVLDAHSSCISYSTSSLNAHYTSNVTDLQPLEFREPLHLHTHP